MDTDKRMDSESTPDDIMLSSAEDLNNDGSFMGAASDMPDDADWEDEKLDRAVAELLESEEADDEQISPAHPEEEAASGSRPQMCQHKPEAKPVEEPVIVVPDVVKPAKHVDRICGPLGERIEETKKTTAKESTQDDAMRQVGINKAALIWMIVLTIILGGVIGIMVYAFILDHMGTTQTPEPDPDSSLQENLNTVAGALEVYLTDVNLDNYNTDIVLVNGGGTVSIKGTLRHSVFINTTSALTLVLNGVTIEPEEGAAIINLTSNALNLRVDGMNTLLADGGSYGAALYSNGSLLIRGDGQIMICSNGQASKAIITKNGYQIEGSTVIALGLDSIERPLDSSTQAYFTKDLLQLYRKGTIVSASDESGTQVVKFTAPSDFASIFVSNSKLADGVQYSISLGGSGAN